MRATAQIQVENTWVKVTEWQFAPGAETGHHVHAYDYVIVPLTTGMLRLDEGRTSRDAQLTAGVAYARQKRVAHNVINPNSFELRFLEIEVVRTETA